MKEHEEYFLETERLSLRFADEEDVPLFQALWNDPRVMALAGYPEGMKLDAEGTLARMHLGGDPGLGRHLVIALANGKTSIGICSLSLPDERKVVTTDVKLFPAFWGHGYEAEIKIALLDYIFTNFDVWAVESSSNVDDIDLIRAQEDSGSERVGEKLLDQKDERVYTEPVHMYVYRVTRENWEARKNR